MKPVIDDEVRLCYLFILAEGREMKNHYEDDRGIYVTLLARKGWPVDTYLLEKR